MQEIHVLSFLNTLYVANSQKQLLTTFAGLSVDLGFVVQKLDKQKVSTLESPLAIVIGHF
jgi:hypothetical protein